LNKLFLLVFLTTGCAYTTASGKACGEPMTVSSWQLFKQPSLTITCETGGGIAYNDQTNSQFFSLVQLLAKIAAAIPK
jgi:hypothetical protein